MGDGQSMNILLDELMLDNPPKRQRVRALTFRWFGVAVRRENGRPRIGLFREGERVMTKEDRRAREFVLEDTYLTCSKQRLDVAVVIPRSQLSTVLRPGETLGDAGRYALGVLVMDDGSSVENYERLKTALSANRSRINEIRVIRTKNIGAYQSRLFAVSLATSTYIKFLDQDDVLLPGVLEREIELANMSGSTVLMTDWEEIWLTDKSDSKVIRHSAPDYGDPILGFLTEGGL